VNEADALKMVAAGCKIVAEGANMPSDPAAIKVYHEKVPDYFENFEQAAMLLWTAALM
jgi:glutamate dehydrogenase/leucine dehydrogenase